jgi:uncharacterized membrane protein
MGHGSAFMLSICAALMHSVLAQSAICSTQMFSNPGNVITYGERFGVVSGCMIYALSATFHMKVPITLTEFKTLHQANFELSMIEYFAQSLGSPPTIHDLSSRLRLSSVPVSTTTLIIDFTLHSPHRIYGTIDAQKVNTYLANRSVPVGTFIAIDDSTGIQENEIIFGTATIIGSVVGGVCLIAIIIGIVCCCRNCHKQTNSDDSTKEKKSQKKAKNAKKGRHPVKGKENSDESDSEDEKNLLTDDK